jgi:transitional endoplasmic reticulum ATPase
LTFGPAALSQPFPFVSCWPGLFQRLQIFKEKTMYDISHQASPPQEAMPPPDPPYHCLIQTWIHRALMPLTGHRALIGEHGYTHSLLAEALALPDATTEEFHPRMAVAHLHAGWLRLEALDVTDLPDTTLEQNLGYLTQLLGLSEAETRIMRFVILLKQDRLLDAAIDCLGATKPNELAPMLARLLAIPDTVAQTAFRENATLLRSGLIEVDTHANGSFLSQRLLLPAGLSYRMMEGNDAGMGVFAECFGAALPSTLDADAFAFMDPAQLLVKHLRTAVSRGATGTNILIHGAPGTGKTEYARWVGSQIDATAFEISTQDAQGLPLFSSSRLKAHQIAQACLSRHARAILIFDEIEDVFSPRPDAKGNVPSIKGWMTRLLESNAVPSIWIANEVRQIDPALIRRFDLVIEASPPPQAERARLLGHASDQLSLRPGWVNAAARHERMTPGIIARATRVVGAMADELKPAAQESALERVLNGILVAQGHRPLHVAEADLHTEFQLDAINADQDLHELVDNLKDRSARLCLYGPPGTGKSAFGRFLADQLGCPLLVKRTSDLLSPYLGQTEHAFARMFEEARSDNAVLLLDETDSFLQDRKTARYHWEISQVNEMLAQLECFQGLFIATTNLMDNLDPAAMRRFDLKIHFDYLKTDQALHLLQTTAVSLGITYHPTSACLNELERYRFTPGDFAVAARQARFRSMKAIEDLVRVVEREAAQRNNSRARSIGFA